MMNPLNPMGGNKGALPRKPGGKNSSTAGGSSRFGKKNASAFPQPGGRKKAPKGKSGGY